MSRVKSQTVPKKLNVLIVALNFCRADEECTPYGVSCLVNAFRSGENGSRDRIRAFTYDLNRHLDSGSGTFKINFKKVARILARKILKSGCNAVAFSTFAWSDVIFKKTMRLLSRRKNHPIVLMGGPMVVGGLALLQNEYPYADFFIESYGEKVFANLRDYLAQAEESGVRLIKDLPDFEKLPSPYLSGNLPVKKGMSVRMELRRGCLFNCAFCRHRNPERKVFCVGCAESHYKELVLFKEKGVAKINVLDPYFNDVRKDFLPLSFNFFEAVKNLELKADISLQIRPEPLTDEYLEVAKTIPNLIFEIGIQSLDEAVLKKINRSVPRELTIQKLKAVQERKIRTEITLIYGLPLQTFSLFKSDIETLKSLGFSKISAFPLQIYRGTEIFENYKEFGLQTRLNEIGILEVCDNPSHDFSKMRNLAQSL